MKYLVLALFLLPVTSSAALISQLTKPTLETTAQFAASYEVQSGLYKGSSYVSIVRITRESSDLKREIRELRRLSDGQYSTPSSVDITALTTEVSINDAVYALFAFNNHLSEPQQDFWLNEWMKVVTPASKNSVVYLSIDENSFGRCRSLVFDDKDNNELLFIGNCYAE